MLTVTLTPKDVILVVMPVEDAKIVVAGSEKVRCAECERLCWQAPGRGYAQVKFGELRPAVGVPEPTVLLCPTCTAVHSGLLPGR